jgi:cell wall-associated NlpC family hydrolase
MRKTAIIVALALIGAFGSMTGDTHHVKAQVSSPSGTGAAIVQTALKLVGAPYVGAIVRGRNPSTGFNDAGFVAYAYNRNGIRLHISWNNSEYGLTAIYQRILRDGPMVERADLQPGDVVYFQNTVWTGLSHVGIYIGGGMFVHAEWYNRGVVVSSFTHDPVDGSYWTGKYLTANRPWSD